MTSKRKEGKIDEEKNILKLKKKEHRKEKMSNMSEIHKIMHNACERDNTRKSRNSMTKEEVEYNKIDDRQRKRRVKNNRIDEVDAGKREFLEWVDFYKESDE